MTLIETPNFKRGIEILKNYEPNPEIDDMGLNEWYIGNTASYENSITKEELDELEILGFHFYEGAECFVFNGSPDRIY